MQTFEVRSNGRGRWDIVGTDYGFQVALDLALALARHGRGAEVRDGNAVLLVRFQPAA